MADLNDLTSNVNIWDDAKSKAVTVSTDGAKERLDVSIDDNINVTVTGDESPTKFGLQSDYDATGVALNTSTDTTLATYTGDGVIDFIAVNSLTSSNFEVALVIDSVERFRISMSDLGSNLGLANAPNVDIWCDTANKNFRYHPVQVGFQTNWTLKAKATATPLPTVKHIILYREKVA